MGLMQSKIWSIFVQMGSIYGFDARNDLVHESAYGKRCRGFMARVIWSMIVYMESVVGGL